MRILHTSDWHIGRAFHGHSTLEALAEVLEALVEQVRTHAVDVVVVAGDVFDSATPAAPAFTLLTDTLLALQDAGARVIATSGNHDSAARLGFQARLLRPGIHVLTDPRSIGDPVTVEDEHGPVRFFGIPFLEPSLVRHVLGGSGSPGDGSSANDSDEDAREVAARPLRTQALAITAAMDIVRAGMAAHPGRSVAIAHCFAAGVEATPHLEREVRQGGLDVVPLSVFDGPDYVALGHIHGRQELSGRVRYSGAPLHYSFGEQDRPRGSWLVDLGVEGVRAVEWLPLPVPRPLVTITGRLEDLLGAEQAGAHADDWVCAVYTDPVPQSEPMRRLRERYPFCALVQHHPEGGSAPDGRSYRERLRSAIGDDERVEAFLVHVRAGAGATDEERVLLHDVLAEQRRAEGAA